jgi:protein CpxP
MEDDMEDGKDTAGTEGRRAMRRGILFGVLGAGALAAMFAARPIAAAVQGGGWHGFRGRWGHHGLNPEAAKEHIQVALKWHLREIDATEEQQARVEKIVTAAVDDLASLRDRHQANGQAFVAGLGAGSIDRAALEEVRKAEVALADEASRRLVQALADVADVLTPEQRQAVLSRAERRRH